MACGLGVDWIFSAQSISCSGESTNVSCKITTQPDQCTRAGTVRELLRPSSSKFKRLTLQFNSVQFPPSKLLWKVRSVQFKQAPIISEVQFIQFEVHSVQFSSAFSSGGRPPPPDEVAFNVP